MDNVNTANKYYNVNTLGTTTIPGHWLLVAIVVGTKGASSSVATLYDSTTDLGANAQYRIGVLDTVNTFGRIEYGIPLLNGIYIVNATGTSADMTVIYRPL